MGSLAPELRGERSLGGSGEPEPATCRCLLGDAATARLDEQCGGVYSVRASE